MTGINYEIILWKINDTGDAPKGKDIYYQCNLCKDIVPSVSGDKLNCKCGNISIDWELSKLVVKDYSNILGGPHHSDKIEDLVKVYSPL